MPDVLFCVVPCVCVCVWVYGSASRLIILKHWKVSYFLQPTEPYITENEELEEDNESENVLEEEIDEEEEDDEDDEKEVGLEDIEALWQASKSTKRDHFSKLQKRLRQLGKMFINQVSYGWLFICAQ